MRVREAAQRNGKLQRCCCTSVQLWILRVSDNEQDKLLLPTLNNNKNALRFLLDRGADVNEQCPISVRSEFLSHDLAFESHCEIHVDA